MFNFELITAKNRSIVSIARLPNNFDLDPLSLPEMHVPLLIHLILGCPGALLMKAWIFAFSVSSMFFTKGTISQAKLLFWSYD